MNRPSIPQDNKANLVNVANGITLLLVIAFAILWAIWIQPHTIALRHIVLSLGSLLGLYVISKNAFLMRSKAALPIYLIGLLFTWITFHLFFLSSHFDLQLDEYVTIWKRILWSTPFAIGLGIALGSKRDWVGQKETKISAEFSLVWWIFFVGLATPTIIYLTRTGLMFIASHFGWTLPPFAMILPNDSTWHIAKMGYIYFCLPALGVACGQFARLSDQQPRFFSYFSGIYAGIILAVFFVFYLENAKNGFVYAAVLCLLMLTLIWLKKRSNWNWRNGAVLIIMLCAVIVLLANHVQQNDSWKTLFSDIKVATQYEEIDAWKDYGARGFPLNDLGKTVSETNYLRAAYAQVVIQFIAERPLGYGLLYQSFGYFAKEKWPNSVLDTAHSAWLDITLGIGIPGVFLLLLSGILALKNTLRPAANVFAVAVFWAVLSIFLLMLTTEVARKVYLESLIFMILLATGIGMGMGARGISLKHSAKRDD
jgi:hypothetical protein